MPIYCFAQLSKFGEKSSPLEALKQVPKPKALRGDKTFVNHVNSRTIVSVTEYAIHPPTYIRERLLSLNKYRCKWKSNKNTFFGYI